MNVDGSDAARRYEIRIEMQRATARRCGIECGSGRGESRAFSEHAVADGNPHLFLRRTGERGPGAIGRIGLHGGADLGPGFWGFAVPLAPRRRDNLLEEGALARAQTLVERLFERDHELLARRLFRGRPRQHVVTYATNQSSDQQIAKAGCGRQNL